MMSVIQRRILLASCLIVLITLAWYQLTVMPPRKALPWSATEIHEDLQTFGIISDYWCILKARIPATEFPVYVSRLKLEQWAPDKDPIHLNWDCSDKAWWTPTAATNGTWFRVNGDSHLYVKFENDWVFVHSFEH